MSTTFVRGVGRRSPTRQRQTSSQKLEIELLIIIVTYDIVESCREKHCSLSVIYWKTYTDHPHIPVIYRSKDLGPSIKLGFIKDLGMRT